MIINDHLKFNDPAPDIELLDLESNPIRLSSLWHKSVLILAFTRHFGCPQCKEMLDQLIQFTPEFVNKGLSLAVVTQASPAAAGKFCSERAPGVTCLADPQRIAYRAFALSKANIFQTFLSRNVMRSNKRLQKEKGWIPEMPPAGQDAFQMSGIFIIGTDGRIRLPYYYDDIADHPSVEILMGGVMGMNWSVPLDSPIDPE